MPLGEPVGVGYHAKGARALSVLFVLLIAGFLLSASTQQAQADAIFDLASDWSDAKNPNGVWQYPVAGEP